MAAICQTCGATGFEELLIYCSECRISAEHLYCVDKISENWKCELCKARDPKTPSPCRLGFYRYRNRKSRLVLAEEDEINEDDVSNIVDMSKIGSPVKFVDVSNIEGFSSKIKDKKFKRSRLVLAEEDEIKDVSGPIGNSAFDKLVSQTGKALSTQATSIYEAYVPAMPIIDPVWRGCFEISNVVYGPLSAHLSNKACRKVWDSALMFSQILHAEKLSRLDVWPESFEASPPDEHNIGLYFFPHRERAVSMHQQLLNDLINKDIALKVTLDTVELIIFTSIILPECSRRFQGKFYLWGGFRGRKVPVQFQGCAESEPKEQKESSSLISVKNSEDSSFSHYLGKPKRHVPLLRMLDRCLTKLGQLDEKHLIISILIVIVIFYLNFCNI